MDALHARAHSPNPPHVTRFPKTFIFSLAVRVCPGRRTQGFPNSIARAENLPLLAHKTHSEQFLNRQKVKDMKEDIFREMRCGLLRFHSQVESLLTGRDTLKTACHASERRMRRSQHCFALLEHVVYLGCRVVRVDVHAAECSIAKL